jgi:hypothetical protein
MVYDEADNEFIPLDFPISIPSPLGSTWCSSIFKRNDNSVFFGFNQGFFFNSQISSHGMLEYDPDSGWKNRGGMNITRSDWNVLRIVQDSVVTDRLYIVGVVGSCCNNLQVVSGGLYAYLPDREAEVRFATPVQYNGQPVRAVRFLLKGSGIYLIPTLNGSWTIVDLNPFCVYDFLVSEKI